MEFRCKQSRLRGDVAIPGSKSHTIRGVLLASLAEGTSVLTGALDSADTSAAVDVYRQLGARIDQTDDGWSITGLGSNLHPPDDVLDVRNSGTTLRVAMGTCALLTEGRAVLTGDAQIQKRPSGPLARALTDLGANVDSMYGNGCPPFCVRGTLTGGRTSLEAKTSQYLTSLLLACPLATGDSEIDVPLLYEKPYVQMTLDWLRFLNVELSNDGLEHFHIPGGQQFRAFERQIPADFSSATFYLAAGALGDNEVTCTGLDMTDSQSDKAVVGFLDEMGAEVTQDGDAVTVRGRQLHGIDIDMNDCPDALPMMAVVGCFASGTTRLLNVPQARIKETDRIAVMCQELRKMGGDVEELPDGLVIRERPLQGTSVSGHHDHRVVMSLAIAGCASPGETCIDSAEAAAVTFPTFAALCQGLGGNIVDA